MRRQLASLLPALALFTLAPSAKARSTLSARVSLTSMLSAEQELSLSDPSLRVTPLGQPVLASPWLIGYGDLRAVLTGTGLAHDRLDLRLDMRVRGTGVFDYESKFALLSLTGPQTQVSSRGYLGGPEFDLREVYLTFRPRKTTALSLGRQIISEADALKLDGARVRLSFNPHWDAGVFVGGYPNPYSRSLLSDYTPPCGAGVASGNSALVLTGGASVPVAAALCQTQGPQLALAAGFTLQYRLRRLWGSAGLVGSFFGGPGDGGAVRPAGGPMNLLGLLAPADTGRDAPRVFMALQQHAQLAGWLSLYGNLVVDLMGSAGAQVTRAIASADVRALADDRLTLRVSYAFLSSQAINMYLSQMLYNRAPNGTSLVGTTGVVENNLTVLRTARHEGRLGIDSLLAARLVLFVEGRLRARALMGGDSNPAVYLSPSYLNQQRSLAGEGTLGLRDGGSLGEIRSRLSYTFLEDFRARSHVLQGGAGRDFMGGVLALELGYNLVLTRDAGVDSTGCKDLVTLQPTPQLGGLNAAQLDPALSVFSPDCYGRRSGTTHEAVATLMLRPRPRWFVLADYRFTAMLTDSQPAPGAAVPTLLGHSAILRVEVSF